MLHAMHKPVSTAYQSDVVLTITVGIQGHNFSIAQPLNCSKKAPLLKF